MSRAADADVARAENALHEAMALVQEHARRGVEVQRKPDGAPVTAADLEVDALLRRTLPDAADGWLSEESVDDASRLERRRVWVVDPLDGTRAFVAGRPDYSVSIALLVDGEPVLGAVGNPASGVTVVGGPGLGVRVVGDPGIPWPAVGTRVLASRSEVRRGEWRHVVDRAAVHPVGSVALQLALVAAGCAHATWTLHPKHEWDVAAGAALVRAAGGDVWLPRGGHLLWNRRRPRFLSFAAAGTGLRATVEPLVGPPRA